MNKFLLPVLPSEAISEAEVCLTIKSPHCQLLIDFLISRKISFNIISFMEERERTNTEQQLSSEAMLINPMGEAAGKPPKDSSQLLDYVYLKYIKKNAGSTPTIDEIAAEIGWNPSRFKTEFKATYGKPFYQAYVEQKMKYAAELLKEGWKAIEVSEKVGYSQPIKFNKMFQKYFGITPKKYQTNVLKLRRQRGSLEVV
ncbi:MAG: AraC family transcriptional regulator [Spirosomataceae bacterium]